MRGIEMMEKLLIVVCLFTTACALTPRTPRSEELADMRTQQVSNMLSSVQQVDCDKIDWSKDVTEDQKKACQQPATGGTRMPASVAPATPMDR